jgi:hypothetical protein
MQRSRVITALAGCAMAAVFAVPVAAQGLDSSVIAAFRWRQIGP